MRLLLCLAGLAFVLLLPTSGVVAENRDCLMCHPEKAKGRSVHPPVGMGCTMCHMGVDASQVPHTFASDVSRGLPAESPRICFGCHDEKDYSGGKVMHSPVSQGMCTICHDPHASNAEKLLVSGDVCFMCHDRGEFLEKKLIHAPVAAGTCVRCHEPHKAQQAKLLKAPRPGLCYSCHGKKRFTGAVVHAPVTFGMCSTCHEPHQSDLRKLARSRGAEMCFACHGKKEVLKKPAHDDAERIGCTTCHNPHASRNASLLR
jgi:predicted CXXCH cytochrome family protein